MKSILQILCLLVVIFTLPSICSAYRKLAHEAINRSVVDIKLINTPLSTYFKNSLGYDAGDIVNGSKTVKDWFVKAGEQEDKPAWRTRNHFLDPVNNLGFNGLVLGLFQIGEPTVVWAQKEVGEQGNLNGGAHSWQDAREYFHSALILDAQSTREQKLADSFRALGQVMHLVADMSVPEHTRDTSHVFTKTIEPWLEEVLNKDTTTHLYLKYFPRISNALYNPVAPDPSLLRQTGRYPGAPIPIANLYDSENYTTNSNPDITVTDPIGLAEYTNANFFSIGTVFRKYDHPAESNTIEYDEIDPVTGEKKAFVASNEVNHLAQANVFRRYLVFGRKYGYAIEDDKIRVDYMEKLIPRAVGYAGALVDYFYRGKLSLSVNPTDITFNKIKVTAQNNTPGETMGAGEVRLVIRYKELSEWPLGNNKYQLNYPSESDYTYKVSAPQNVDLSVPQQLNFDFSDDPLPYFFSDISMQLVFKGKLGNEEGAVAISPITTIDGIYSDIDLSLPYNGSYAKVTSSSLGATFNELKVTTKTNIPGGVSGGSFALALEYRETGGNPFLSLPVDTEPANAATYVIKVPEKYGVNTLPQSSPVELTFDLSQVPLSVRSTDLHLNILYIDSATSKPRAIGYHDISEPTPIDAFNNTDYVCLNNQWYPAGDPAIIPLADQLGNRNGYDDDIDRFRHDFANIYYKLTSSSSPTTVSTTDFTLFEAGPIAPATFKRLGFVLTDYALKYSSLRDWVHTESADIWTGGIGSLATLESGMGVKNQTDDEGVTTFPFMYNMRGKLMWGGAGTVYGNAKLPTNASCDWALLPAAP